MRDYYVYEERPVTGLRFIRTITAASAIDALRIAKQKGVFCPVVGESK